MTERATPVGPSSGLTVDPNDQNSAPALDVDAAETAPPPATLVISLLRTKPLLLVGAACLFSAGLLLIWQRTRQQ